MIADPITLGEQRVSRAFTEADAAPNPRPAELASAIADANGKVVYFIQAGEAGPVKIGVSRRTQVQRRVAQLQTGSAYPLRLLGFTFGDQKLEGTLHRLFGHLRMHGEWFWPHPQLLAIASIDMDAEMENYQ